MHTHTCIYIIYTYNSFGTSTQYLKETAKECQPADSNRDGAYKLPLSGFFQENSFYRPCLHRTGLPLASEAQKEKQKTRNTARSEAGSLPLLANKFSGPASV